MSWARLKIKSYVALQVRPREEIGQVLPRRGGDVPVGLLVSLSSFYKSESTMECTIVDFALGGAWECEGEKERDLSQILPCCQMLLGAIKKWRPPTAATCTMWLRCPRTPTATRGNRTRQLLYISTLSPHILNNALLNPFSIRGSRHVKDRIPKTSALWQTYECLAVIENII